MESMIFGKNRHFFGGLEPSNMRKFQAKVVDGQVEITAELPNDTVVDGQTLCTVAGAVIRRKIGSYPVDEFDGDLFLDIKESGTYVDDAVALEDAACYAAFPYTDQGVYNRSITGNRASLVYTPDTQIDYIFGYDLDLYDPDPSTRVSYPEDVDNYGYTPVGMNYSTNVFEYGSWPSIAGEGFIPRPCMLNRDGTIAHYLDPSDYSLTIDGSQSNIANGSSKDEAMMEWPKIYTKRWEENGIYHFRCSDHKVDETWDCWCNYDANNNEIDHFYTSIYVINTLSTSAYSMATSGSLIHDGNALSKSISNIAATPRLELGDHWNCDLLCDTLLIQDLLVLMGRSTDCQTVYGMGRCKADYTSSSGIKNGTLDNKGLFWGSNQTGSNVKVFGMESRWGVVRRWIDGAYVDTSGRIRMKITEGTHDGSTVVGYGKSGYADFLKSGMSTSGANDYCRWMNAMDYGRWFTERSGSSTTYECDWVGRITATSSATHTFYHGGVEEDDKTKNGPFYLYADANDGATGVAVSRSIGLSYKPSAT